MIKKPKDFKKLMESISDVYEAVLFIFIIIIIIIIIIIFTTLTPS